MKHRILMDIEKAGSFSQWLTDEIKGVKPKKVRKPRRKPIAGERVFGEASSMVKRLVAVYRKVRNARTPLTAELASTGAMLQPYMEPFNEDDTTAAVLKIGRNEDALNILETYEQVRSVDRKLYFMQLHIYRQITVEISLICTPPSGIMTILNSDWKIVFDPERTAAARGVSLLPAGVEAPANDDDEAVEEVKPPRDKYN